MTRKDDPPIIPIPEFPNYQLKTAVQLLVEWYEKFYCPKHKSDNSSEIGTDHPEIYPSKWQI